MNSNTTSAPASSPTPALPSLEELESAAALVYGAMPPTPQYCWPLLQQEVGAEVWVKHENHTPVGAFKIRGGFVYIDRLIREHPEIAGVVTATRGNHGQSIGFAARRHGLRAAVVVPHGNSVEKNAAMRALGVELIEHGDDFQDSVEAAAELATERGWHRVPSFHRDLVSGVGTYALEFLRGTPPLDTVYVPIGLGSGTCGMIAARDALGLKTAIVGVVSAGAPAYALSIAAGRPISHAVTTQVADGMACRTPIPAALEAIGRGIDRVVEVTDAQIESAMRLMFAATHAVAEGAGAAGLAALLKERDGERAPARGQRVGVVLTGGNVDADVFARILLSGAA